MKPDFEKSDNQKHKFHKISGIIFAAFIFVTGAIGLIQVLLYGNLNHCKIHHLLKLRNLIQQLESLC